MMFKDRIPTEPLSTTEVQQMHEQLLRRHFSRVDDFIFDTGSKGISQMDAFMRPSTTPMPSRTVKKQLLNTACALGMADWPFAKAGFPTRPVDPARFAFHAKALQPAGIVVSEGLIVDRDTLKSSVLIVPSGLYLTWLEASEEEVDDLAF